MLPSCGLSPRLMGLFLGGIFSDYDVIISFRKDQPQSEGSRHAHHGIKSPPDIYIAYRDRVQHPQLERREVLHSALVSWPFPEWTTLGRLGDSRSFTTISSASLMRLPFTVNARSHLLIWILVHLSHQRAYNSPDISSISNDQTNKVQSSSGLVCTLDADSYAASAADTSADDGHDALVRPRAARTVRRSHVRVIAKSPLPPIHRAGGGDVGPSGSTVAWPAD